MPTHTTHVMRQLTIDWWMVRRGIPSASNFDMIMTPKQRKPSAGARGYILDLIADRYDAHYGEHDHGYYKGASSVAMKDGNRFEGESRDFYAMETGIQPTHAGFIINEDEFSMPVGSSPDSVIMDDGTLELKNPQPKTHIEWLLGGKVPDDHVAQVHGHIITTGRPWCDFMSYCPGLPTLRVRTHDGDDNNFTGDLRNALSSFCDLYKSVLEEFSSRFGPPIK